MYSRSAVARLDFKLSRKTKPISLRIFLITKRNGNFDCKPKDPQLAVKMVFIHKIIRSKQF